MKSSHRYNGSTIGSQRQSFIRSPSISSDIESSIPIWSLIGISEQEYNYRFNMPITITKDEIKEEISKEIKEEIKEEIEEIKEEINDDYKNMTFEAKPSLVRQSKSLRFQKTQSEWV